MILTLKNFGQFPVFFLCFSCAEFRIKMLKKLIYQGKYNILHVVLSQKFVNIRECAYTIYNFNK